MTGEGDVQQEIATHEESYARFMWWLKTGMVVVAIIVAFVMFVITR